MMKPEFTFSFPIEIKAKEGVTTKIEMKMDSNQTSHTTSYTVDKNEFEKAQARIAALEEVVREFLTVENTLPLDMDGYSICQFCEFDNGIDRMNQHELNCIYIKARAVLEGK